MWTDGTPTRVIAETLKITADRCDATRRKLGLPRRESWHGTKRGKRAAYIPTPEEILRKCKEFQDGWTDEERRSRIVGNNQPRAEIRIIPEAVLRANYQDAIRESDQSSLLEDLIRDSSG